MRIKNNVFAMNTFRQLGVNNYGVGKSLEKLSSRLRINRANDAAVLEISSEGRKLADSFNKANSTNKINNEPVQAIQLSNQSVKEQVQSRQSIQAVKERAEAALESLQSKQLLQTGSQDIKDVDIASGTTTYTRNQILVQSGIEPLGKENKRSSVLDLLI